LLQSLVLFLIVFVFVQIFPIRAGNGADGKLLLRGGKPGERLHNLHEIYSVSSAARTPRFLVSYFCVFRLFLEKIRSHPDLAAVSQADRDNNKKKLKDILPIAEKIKTKLTVRFAEEHEQYKVCLDHTPV
jgi:hypothetical protein